MRVEEEGKVGREREKERESVKLPTLIKPFSELGDMGACFVPNTSRMGAWHGLKCLCIVETAEDKGTELGRPPNNLPGSAAVIWITPGNAYLMNQNLLGGSPGRSTAERGGLQRGVAGPRELNSQKHSASEREGNDNGRHGDAAKHQSSMCHVPPSL